MASVANFAGLVVKKGAFYYTNIAKLFTEGRSVIFV